MREFGGTVFLSLKRQELTCGKDVQESRVLLKLILHFLLSKSLASDSQTQKLCIRLLQDDLVLEAHILEESRETDSPDF